MNIAGFIKNFSTFAHIAGSPQDNVTAQWAKSLFESWGYKTNMIEIPVMLSYPSSRLVQVVYPPNLVYTAKLEEIPIDDGTEGNATMTWNGYSASGEATGELVYANYGMEEDYKRLDDLGVNLTGKIVIVRYGNVYRGNKAKFAIDRNASGVLIYVDPGDTGDVMAAKVGQKVFPKGPWSTNTTVQRGTVWLGEGDPSTPGWPSTSTGPRLSLEQAQDPDPSLPFAALPSIPVQPIGYGDALHLLQGLGGNPIPNETWGGGFNLTHIGPGPVKVYMKVNATFPVTPIWDVVATIKGATEPDHYVLVGCHRDAWTFGAEDPISGHSVLLETARALSETLKTGWRPKRSIVFFSWDAEEFALVGSVELLERRLSVIGARAVSYFNLDVGLIREVTQLVKIPGLKSGDPQRRLWDIFDGNYNIPGTGSDHTGFAHHAGVPIVYMGIGESDGDYDAVYHSNYDSYFWVANFGDPSFEYHAALARTFGGLIIRMASDSALPFNYSEYSDVLVNQIGILANVTGINSKNLKASVDQFRSAAEATQSVLSSTTEPNEILQANRRLMLTERSFLNAEISPVPWFWHVIWTPSPFNSYAGGAFFAVYNAKDSNSTGVHSPQFLADRIAQVIEGAADFLAPDYFF